MSKVKTPRQKKSLSLVRDRRNIFGENSKASRKNIAKGQQRRRMDERRSVAQVLARLNGHVEDDVASEAELQVKLTIAHVRHWGFRKTPDQPLGVVLERKKARKVETTD